MVASLAPIPIPPLPDFPLPRLPPISDRVLKTTVFTHSSMHQSIRNPQSLTLEELPTDYEKFEHVGDGILGGLVTLLLHDLYPNLPPGTATILKAHLVNNETLSQLSTRFGIVEDIIASPSAMYTVKGQTKAQASVFEAYIAGVYYDFLQSETPGGYDNDDMSVVAAIDGESTCDDISVDGMATSQASDKTQSVNGDRTLPACPVSAQADSTNRAPNANGSLMSACETIESMARPKSSPTPLPDLLDRCKRTNGQAMDYVAHYIWPIFTPVAHFAFGFMRETAEALERLSGTRGVDEPLSDDLTVGTASALNQHCQAVERRMPVYSYIQKDVNQWECGCTVTINDVPFEATAVRGTKKLAMGVAAWKIGKQLELPWAR